MDWALVLICVKSDDLSVLWCINHIEYVPLDNLFWLESPIYRQQDENV